MNWAELQRDPEARRRYFEDALENAQHMLKLEREIASERGWSPERAASAAAAIPGWENRVNELKLILKLK